MMSTPQLLGMIDTQYTNMIKKIYYFLVVGKVLTPHWIDRTQTWFIFMIQSSIGRRIILIRRWHHINSLKPYRHARMIDLQEVMIIWSVYAMTFMKDPAVHENPSSCGSMYIIISWSSKPKSVNVPDQNMDSAHRGCFGGFFFSLYPLMIDGLNRCRLEYIHYCPLEIDRVTRLVGLHPHDF